MQNYTKPIPKEIQKWNWGAFAFNIVWGVGNKVYLPFLCLIPIFNVVWIFFCGAKGNEWAWQAGDYESVEEFQAVQATWNRAGLVAFIISAACFALLLILMIFMSILAARLIY